MQKSWFKRTTLYTLDLWIIDFKEWAQSQFEKDDDASIWEVCMQADMGAANGPPMPNGGGALITATRLKKRRHLAAKRYICQLQLDKRIRDMVIRLDNGDAMTNDANALGVVFCLFGLGN